MEVLCEGADTAPLGMLIVVSGPSGVGKDTVVREFLKSSDNCVLSVSATTRPIRPAEVPGRDYFFLERDDFIQKAQRGEMLESAEYNGSFYGTPREAVWCERLAGRHVILIIEVQGAMSVQKLCPEAVLVFIKPPTVDSLRERLLARGTDDEQSIGRRMKIAEGEIEFAKMYNYIITNDDYKMCAADLDTVIRAAAMSPRHAGVLI